MNELKELEAPIAASVFAPLTSTRWRSDDYQLHKFETSLETHKREDGRDGHTCVYDLSPGMCEQFNNSILNAEFKALRKDGVIPTEFYNGDCVNQHWLHSLEQFYSAVTHEWKKHIARTEALVGTPAGRIARGAKHD